MITLELFERGGYKTIEDGYLVIYPERVLSRTILTPDGNGQVVSVTEEISSADGAPPVQDEFLGIFPTAGTEEGFDLAEWLNAQLQVLSIIEERGFTYAGRFSLNGRPSIRYELRSSMSALPNGQVFDPPAAALLVLEFVEANPLLAQESRYTVLGNGELVLDSRQTTLSVSVGE